MTVVRNLRSMVSHECRLSKGAKMFHLCPQTVLRHSCAYLSRLFSRDGFFSDLKCGLIFMCCGLYEFKKDSVQRF